MEKAIEFLEILLSEIENKGQIIIFQAVDIEVLKSILTEAKSDNIPRQCD